MPKFIWCQALELFLNIVVVVPVETLIEDGGEVFDVAMDFAM